MTTKILVIAEKPDMGRNIAAAIAPKAVNKRTHLEGGDYIITWAIGHLVTLAEPDKYDDKYRKWSLQQLPIIPEQFLLVPNEKTKSQLEVIADLAKRCGRLVNACDAGREGQYIFSLIQRYLRLQQPVQRLWISDLTPETIRAGFASLKNGEDYDNLTKAARARSEADWLIGMNGSRAFTTKHNVLLSVGRVQTPVLALIYDRQCQIDAFSSSIFYEIVASFRQDNTVYRGLWQGERLTDKLKADAIAAKTSGQPGKINSYEVKDTKEFPPKLFDLTLLQREANGKLGFSAKKTLDVAQSLYEKHKVITYPRTNSNYVTEANIPDMHRALGMLRGTAYGELAGKATPALVHAKNIGICNAAKVEDHHAILPTRKQPGSLSADEQRVYDLIVRRFLSQFFPPALYKVHTVLSEVAGELFKTTVKQQLDQGWKVVQPSQAAAQSGADADHEEQQTDAPFELDASEPVMCESSEVKEKQTQPPKPYTEGTLLKAMESAGKQIEDEELRDAMKDSGLGTPATRAATIERLKQVEYIRMQGKRIVITNKGKMAVQTIRSAGVQLLASPEMTGHWERRLNEIAKGAASDVDFMNKVKQFAALIVDKVKLQPRADKSAFEAERPSRAPRAKRTPQEGRTAIADCPRPGCGGHIIAGRKGYGCTNYKTGCSFVVWKSSFNKTLSEATVRTLITKGKTGKLKFSDNDGNAYEARIVMSNPATGAIALEQIAAKATSN